MNFIQAKNSTNKDFMTGVASKTMIRTDSSIGHITARNIDP